MMKTTLEGDLIELWGSASHLTAMNLLLHLYKLPLLPILIEIHWTGIVTHHCPPGANETHMIGLTGGFQSQLVGVIQSVQENCPLLTKMIHTEELNCLEQLKGHTPMINLLTILTDQAPVILTVHALHPRKEICLTIKIEMHTKETGSVQDMMSGSGLMIVLVSGIDTMIVLENSHPDMMTGTEIAMMIEHLEIPNVLF